MAHVFRTDISALRPVERREDGTIRVDAHLSKCGVFQYLQSDGTVRRELRLPEDVFDNASLASFEGVPVTDNHPPGMLDSRTTRQYSVGAVLGTPTPDADHMRGRFAVYDADTISKMESGKLQVSNGYTCDTIEEPGVHPLYGIYDAVQKNIRGNHVAIVDRARAGITAAARMDADVRNGMMVLSEGESTILGTGIAISQKSCHDSNVMHTPSARVEVVIKNDAGQPSATAVVDPNDEANRSARGANDAPKSKKRQPGEMADRSVDTVHGATPDDDDYENDPDADESTDMGDMHKPDAYDSSYDTDGELTQSARDKIKASNFAVPDQEKLPIHDKPHVRAAMSRFGQTDFGSADEKHAAFNRIKSKAKSFGVSTEGFEKAHAGKLDRADGARKENQMNPTEIKALQEKADKADKRKEKLVAAKARIDALEADVAKLQGDLESARRDLEASKKGVSQVKADEASPDQVRLDAKLELLDNARQTGAKVDSKMSDVEIKRTVIKHVDGADAPEGKAEAYYDALYDGALKRAKQDAGEAVRGSAALAGARAAVETARAGSHLDADADEDAARDALRAHSRGQALNHTGLNGSKPIHKHA